MGNSPDRCLQTYQDYTAQPDHNPDAANGILAECSQIKGILISCYIMMFLLSCLLAPMCYITAKVHSLVWDKDKTLVVMLFFLTASLFAFVLYFAFNIVIENSLVWQFEDGHSYNCTLVFFVESPCFLLSCGILLNLNKWVQYFIKIFTHVKIHSSGAAALKNSQVNVMVQKELTDDGGSTLMDHESQTPPSDSSFNSTLDNDYNPRLSQRLLETA